MGVIMPPTWAQTFLTVCEKAGRCRLHLRTRHCRRKRAPTAELESSGLGRPVIWALDGHFKLEILCNDSTNQ